MESEITVEICFSMTQYCINSWCMYCLIDTILSYSYISSCWLSVEKGTIFGFVGPMLAIILVSAQRLSFLRLILL